MKNELKTTQRFLQRYRSRIKLTLIWSLVAALLLALIPAAIFFEHVIAVDGTTSVSGRHVASTGTPHLSTTPIVNPTSSPPSGGLLPGQQLWKNGVSSYLFGTNDSEDYGPDNFDTDPHHIIQPSLRTAGLTLMRMFIFHYRLVDGHRVTLGTNPQIQLNSNPHEFDTPGPAVTNVTPNGGYELETRLRAIENSGMQCLIVLPDIRTDPANPKDPNPTHNIYTDPSTGKVETDLEFAEKVVAYAGNRCNLYEIGNEPDLDIYTGSGAPIPHIKIQTYLNRWVEFVTALRKINPNAKFIGPVTYNDQGNDCYGSGPPPVPGAQPGDCYMQLFLRGAKQLGVLPDAVSFHWYPCDNATNGFNGSGNCGAKQAQSYASVTREVKGWVKADTGYTIPVGITEWNFDSGANPLGNNGSFMSQFSTAALNAMMSAGLNFACQFDAQDYGEYGYLDMFDLANNDQPKAQFTTMADIIKQFK